MKFIRWDINLENPAICQSSCHLSTPWEAGEGISGDEHYVYMEGCLGATTSTLAGMHSQEVYERQIAVLKPTSLWVKATLSDVTKTDE